MRTEGYVIGMRIPIGYDFPPPGEKNKNKIINLLVQCSCERPSWEGRVTQQLRRHAKAGIGGERWWPQQTLAWSCCDPRENGRLVTVLYHTYCYPLGTTLPTSIGRVKLQLLVFCHMNTKSLRLGKPCSSSYTSTRRVGERGFSLLHLKISKRLEH